MTLNKLLESFKDCGARAVGLCAITESSYDLPRLFPTTFPLESAVWYGWMGQHGSGVYTDERSGSGFVFCLWTYNNLIH